MEPPVSHDEWVALSAVSLPVTVALEWVGRADCGANVVFTGTTRDHSGDRRAVSLLEYEAYEDHAVPRMAEIADEIRVRWPSVGRIALLHRIGPVELGDPAVVIAVSSPHRDEAFAAARFGIDTLKATVPIWKREVWDGGESWGLEPQHITEIDAR